MRENRKANLEPLNYKIHIQPDMQDFTFDGIVEISILAEHPVCQVVLNAHELLFQECSLKTGSDRLACPFELSEARQEISIHLPEDRVGKIELVLHYSGRINDQYAGFYRSRYKQMGQDKYIASTQFEAMDARRAFPCFDQPDLKASFEIELVVDRSLTGIANTAVLEEKDLGNGKKLIRFEQTPRLSTYLVFFGVGEFEFLEDASEQPLVRVATTQGKTRYADFALKMGRKSLQFGAAYCGIPFPLSKCDYLAVPDSLGAMENFGAIRHAEEILLVFPGLTSRAKETLITKIIAHETLHMWFGGLVSPVDWKFLWLNEAFATYFTYVVPHFYYPTLGVWNQFFPERLLPALERDALAGTLPIDLPAADNPLADLSPTPSSAPIVYNKGAAILRMLAAYLGEDCFRRGLQDYLGKFQFQAVSSTQFWTTIEQSSGKPLERFSETWISQAGYPVVVVRRDADRLQLTQERFGYSSEIPEAAWLIPVDILLFLENGETRLEQVVLDKREQAYQLPKNTLAYKLNAGFTGYYRVDYPREAWAELGQLAQQRKLSALDRLNIFNDLFALVKAGRYSLREYLQTIREYAGDEDDYLLLTDLIKNLGQIYALVEAQRYEISQLGIPMIERNLQRIGFQPAPDETSLTAELRETLIWAGFQWGSRKVTAFGLSQFQEFLENKQVDGDLLGVILKIGAVCHAEARETLLKTSVDSALPESGRIMALEALGYTPDIKQLAQMLEKNISEIPVSLRVHMISAAGQNLAARDMVWKWFILNFSRLEILPPAMLERIIVGIIPICGMGHVAEVHQLLDRYVDHHTNSRDSIRMAYELLAVNEQLRNN